MPVPLNKASTHRPGTTGLQTTVAVLLLQVCVCVCVCDVCDVTECTDVSMLQHCMFVLSDVLFVVLLKAFQIVSEIRRNFIPNPRRYVYCY